MSFQIIVKFILFPNITHTFISLYTQIKLKLIQETIIIIIIIIVPIIQLSLNHNSTPPPPYTHTYIYQFSYRKKFDEKDLQQ